MDRDGRFAVRLPGVSAVRRHRRHNNWPRTVHTIMWWPSTTRRRRCWQRPRRASARFATASCGRTMVWPAAGAAGPPTLWATIASAFRAATNIPGTASIGRSSGSDIARRGLLPIPSGPAQASEPPRPDPVEQVSGSSTLGRTQVPTLRTAPGYSADRYSNGRPRTPPGMPRRWRPSGSSWRSAAWCRPRTPGRRPG